MEIPFPFLSSHACFHSQSNSQALLRGVGIIQTEEKGGLSDTCPRRRPRVLKENQAWVLEQEREEEGCVSEKAHLGLRTCVFH